MSPDDLKRIRFNSSTLARQAMMVNANQGQADPDAVRALGAGSIDGITDALVSYVGAKVAFDVLHEILDRIGAPLLADQPAGPVR